MVTPEEFLRNCLLPKKQKDGIWNAIIKKKYIGFHHLPGRYRCGLCEPQRHRSYFYPWELTFLNFHCDIDSIWGDSNRRKELILNDFPHAAIYSALCCKHFKEISIKFLPEINISEYVVIILNVNDNTLRVEGRKFIDLQDFEPKS